EDALDRPLPVIPAKAGIQRLKRVAAQPSTGFAVIPAKAGIGWPSTTRRHRNDGGGAWPAGGGRALLQKPLYRLPCSSARRCGVPTSVHRPRKWLPLTASPAIAARSSGASLKRGGPALAGVG